MGLDILFSKLTKSICYFEGISSIDQSQSGKNDTTEERKIELCEFEIVSKSSL
jgi:hypothetical protein